MAMSLLPARGDGEAKRAGAYAAGHPPWSSCAIVSCGREGEYARSSMERNKDPLPLVLWPVHRIVMGWASFMQEIELCLSRTHNEEGPDRHDDLCTAFAMVSVGLGCVGLVLPAP